MLQQMSQNGQLGGQPGQGQGIILPQGMGMPSMGQGMPQGMMVTP